MAAGVNQYKIDKVDRFKLGNVNMNLVYITFGKGGSDTFQYATGGFTFTPIQFGVQRLVQLSGMTELGQQATFTESTGTYKVELYNSGGVQLANENASLDGEKAILVAIGY